MDRAAEIAAQNFFSLAHPEFYETLSSYEPSREYTDILEALLPEGWALERDEVWLHVRSPSTRAARLALRPLPAQGFKIHLSSAPEHALDLLEIAATLCLRAGIGFKIAADPNLHSLLNSKGQSRGSSGKFMTIYSTNEETFKALIEDLYQRTEGLGFRGPYILSDRRYKDSKVIYYRYGGFHPPYRLNIDGSMSSFLVSPDGEYVPDERLPFFRLPEWIEDPFGGSSNVEREESLILNQRYLIEGAFGFSNAGGVYYGVDTKTNSPVVVKEARPCTNHWSVDGRSWDAVHLLEREYEILTRLRGLDFVPAPVDLFQDWEHSFLVEERIQGVTLDVYWAQDSVILAPYIRRPGTIERFLPRFKQVALALTAMVRNVHERGVILGDLSPRNVMITPETLKLWLIDFESAVVADDEAALASYASRWGTEGFVNPARRIRGTLRPEDDFYSLAMTLYNCVVPVNNLFILKPEAQSVFLDKFVALGLPREVKEIIALLSDGDIEEAENLIAGWQA